MAQSLSFHSSPGAAAYRRRSSPTYEEHISVTGAWKRATSALTSSQAIRRRVSLSLPSMSRRMYSV